MLGISCFFVSSAPLLAQVGTIQRTIRAADKLLRGMTDAERRKRAVCFVLFAVALALLVLFLYLKFKR